MIIVVMGVSGSGKTTVGRQLAAALDWPFIDADTFHPAANRAKLQQGIPLTDADRDPWLQELQRAIATWLAANSNGVLACSALKASYRQRLWCDPQQMYLVYLQGSFRQIAERLAQREHEFMPSALLQSQFEILEEPEDAIRVSIDDPPAVMVAQIRSQLGV